MKLNKRHIIGGILILLLLLLICLKQCNCSSSVNPITIQDTTVTIPQQNKIIEPKKDTVIKVLKTKKTIKNNTIKSAVSTPKDTLLQEKNQHLIDSLKNLLLVMNKEFQTKSQKEGDYLKQINFLEVALKQKEDSIVTLLATLKQVQLDNLVESKKTNEKSIDKKEYFDVKNILFKGLYTDPKTGTDQITVYGGLIKQVLLSMDFTTNIPIKPDNRKKTIYIRISDLQTEQLIYMTEQKPKEPYELAGGEKINYSLQTQITLNQNNMASLKITYPMKWTLKRNSAIKVEVFYNKQKIGEHIGEIKSGIPVTTW